MRSLYNWALIALLTVAVSGCSDDGVPSGHFLSLRGYYLNISEREFEFDAVVDQPKYINVISVTTPWRFSGMDNWLYVSPSSGEGSAEVTLRASENTSGENARTNVFQFQSTDKDYKFTQQITAHQSPAESKLDVQSSLSVGAKGGEFHIAVDANIAYTVSSSKSWLTATKSDDGCTLTINVPENHTGKLRSAYIQLSGKISQSVYVSQDAASVNSNDTGIECPVEGASYQVNITSDVSWTAQTSDSWIAVTPDEGNAGTTTVLITVAENSSAHPRRGYVQILTDDYKALKIQISQDGLYITFGENSVNFGSESGSHTTAISSNTFWEIISKPIWVTVSETSGTGDGQITLSVDDNWSLTPRSGSIVIGNEEISGLSDTLAVSQAARVFNDMIGSLSFGVGQETQTVEIDTDGQWVSSTEDEWIHLNPTSGTGKKELKIRVDANLQEDERNGTVTVTVDGLSKTIAVEQMGRFMTVASESGAMLPSTGGRHMVSISTNDSWTATVGSPSWMHISQTSGTGNIQVTLTADDNPSSESRSDTTVFSAANIQYQYRIITEQAGRYLTLDKEKITFLNTGGNAVLDVSTDGTFKVTVEEGDWLTAVADGNTVVVNAQRNETGEDRTGKVVVSLTGLQSGSLSREIVIIQKGESGYIIELFDEDEQWELSSEGSIKVTVTGFGTDKQWDSSTGTSGNIDGTGFSEDKKWD